MGFNLDTQATRSTLMSVDSTLSENITAAQDYIPIASTTNFSTAIVAEIETTNEVVSFTDISENELLYSQTFQTSWTNTAMTITADSTTAPDGTTTADKIVPTTASTTHFLYQSPTTSGATTLSIYAKTSGYDWIKLFMVNSSTCSANFNISTGVLGTTGGSAFSTSTITDVGEGWYRCTMTNTGAIASGNSGAYVTSVESNPPTSGLTESGNGTDGAFWWGAQLEESTTATTYLPTTTAALVGLTGVTRGVNGTTAALATSGDAIQQLPYALSEVNMPTRLRGISVSSDGTGAGRFTLCDKIGTTLCDIDIPDAKIYDLSFGGGIIFPNGIYVSNSDNITGYTLYTDKHSGAAL